MPHLGRFRHSTSAMRDRNRRSDLPDLPQHHQLCEPTLTGLGKFHAGGKRLKFSPGSRVIGTCDGPEEYRGRCGTVIEYLGGSQYRIRFDDDGEPECVLSQWLELVIRPE